MTEESQNPKEKTDWSKLEPYRKEKDKPAQLTPHAKPYPVAKPAGQGDVDEVLSSALLPKNTDEPEGILLRFKKGQITRKAAGQELEARYKGRLEVIKHGVEQSVRVKKAEIDNHVELYLAELEAEHLKLATELGIANSGYRDDVAFRLAEQSNTALIRAMNADWHPDIKQRVIDDIFALHSREHDKIMRELGTKDEPA